MLPVTTTNILCKKYFNRNAVKRLDYWCLSSYFMLETAFTKSKVLMETLKEIWLPDKSLHFTRITTSQQILLRKVTGYTCDLTLTTHEEN